MIQNIFVGLLTLVVIAAAIWGWWLENEGTKMPEDEKNKNVTENMEVGNDCYGGCESKKERD